MASVRSKIGDIFEIKTREGLAYAQYTQESESDGALIRVFEGLHEKVPTDLKKIANGFVAFATFFPVQAAIKQGLVRRVGHAEIAPTNKEMPVFRWGIPHPLSKKVEQWYLWDGTDHHKIDSLSEDQRKMPIREIMLMEGLTTAIEEGWKPEKDRR